jgi:hypothetical protein
VSLHLLKKLDFGCSEIFYVVLELLLLVFIVPSPMNIR